MFCVVFVYLCFIQLRWIVDVYEHRVVYENYCLIYHAIYACTKIVVLPVGKLRSRWNVLDDATRGSTSTNVFERPNLNLPVSSLAMVFAAVSRPLLVFVGGSL